ncbi:ABC transporter [Fusarium albosuccineum]|uniref:ABC transporter n=1 Tax=Fusarium albosuccineum TaxID=1237068 RepID=A0A8H4PKY4_9HYPO|nr:ABC transporter [Fusarium albosuccineum]
MVLFDLRAFARQLCALVYKNLLVSVVRHPLGFLLSVYGFPLAILAVLCSIPSFLSSSNVFGVASPAPIKNLADTIHGKLVIVKPPRLGPDVDHVISTFTKDVDENKLLFLDNESYLTTVCLANLRGVSECHAAVTFIDSPLTNVTVKDSQSSNHTWQYTLRADPSMDDMHFNAKEHDSDQENLYLPLQLAINNAITNSTTVPEVFMFTAETQEEQNRLHREDSVLLIGQVYVFALFACYFFIIYRFTGLITAERESGMSQLVDAMGGGSAVAARVLGWLIVFDVLCLPCFIAFGALYGHLMFPTSSLGLIIGWQILLGLAVNSSTVFAAAFFTKSRVSAIYVIGAFLLLSVAAQIYSFQLHPRPQFIGVLLLSLLFPSSNHVFFTQQMCLWELNSTSARIDQIAPDDFGINSESYGRESSQELDELIKACDLDLKRNSLAGTLSGGQKRKLQLACMFVGDSSVCLIDECTSGLDPLSRRVIWEILLQQRSKRSIIFTTHFLDEVDVLADHIVILSKGKVRCQGAAAELKNLHGGGYKVLAPSSAPRINTQFPPTMHQDHVVYATPDSRSAAELCSLLDSRGVRDVSISGPQVEDVFLRVADEPDLEPTKSHVAAAESEFEMTPGEVTSFWAQVRILFRKRFTVLRRFWWPYLYVLALPLIITPQFKDLLKEYKQPSCEPIKPELNPPSAPTLSWTQSCVQFGCDTLAVAPKSANKTLYNIVREGFYEVDQVDPTLYKGFPVVLDGRQTFLDYITDHRDAGPGGVYMGSNDEAPVLAYRLNTYGSPSGSLLMSLWSQMNSNVEIIASQQGFAKTRRDANNIGVIYVVFFTLLQTIYPAAFVLYPAIEKARKVRALEYANGVRRGPLWVAYGMFDFIFVLAISAGVTATIRPLKSFLAMAGVSVLMYAIAAISFAVGSGYSDAAQMDKLTLGIAFGVYLILPIGNVFRAMLIGLNVLEVGCKDGEPTPPASIYGYGGPILYLVLQIIVLLLIIIWIEEDIALFRRKGGRTTSLADAEKDGRGAASDEVKAEALRVEDAESDLLRTLHLTKSFGSNRAVDDVSFGLPQSDVMALIGPNGAGKSTLVNMIQSELSADTGKVLLRGEDARTRSAQKYLGVCPQYDALDLMNTRDHLSFYARIKGIRDVRGNVDHVMKRLNLDPHARTLASKLSGGNKRKLSLAIALMGKPPVLVLDEPTSAMDAVAKRAFWKIIQEITPNRSLLLTTHSMEEADTLATRTAIISKRLLAVGTTQALRKRYSNVYYVSLLLKTAPNSTAEEMERVRRWVLAALPGAQLERDMLGGQVRFTIPGASPVARVIELLELSKDEVGAEYYSIGGATLERVFLSVVRENNVQEEDGLEKGRVWRWLGLK